MTPHSRLQLAYQWRLLEHRPSSRSDGGPSRLLNTHCLGYELPKDGQPVFVLPLVWSCRQHERFATDWAVQTASNRSIFMYFINNNLF